MPKWTDYTTKTNPADNDEVMILDTAGKANKRLGLSALSDWIIGKIANKVFENLQTQNKTILGALNELNSNNIKYKDITVNDFSIGNQMISGTDKGYFSRVGPIKDYIPDYKAVISATIVSFGDCEGMVTAVFYIAQSEPAIYLLSNTKSTIANCVIRIAYI